MKRFLLSLLLAIGCLFLATDYAHASLVRIDKNKEVIWQVLGSDLEVKNSASTSGDATITIEKQGEEIFLNDLDVTGYQDSLVEIEERPDVREIKISIHDGVITLEQEGVKVVTDLPITIDPKKDRFAVATDEGSIFVLVMPYDAAQTAVRSKFLSQVNENGMRLVPVESGLAYRVEGEKVVNIFNFFDYKIPVTAQVSASTGELLMVEGPEWFKIFGFLFS